MMTLLTQEQTINLIEESCKKDKDFAARLSYWVHKRQRIPSQAWLMEKFISILGYDRMCHIVGYALNEQKTGQKQ